MDSPVLTPNFTVKQKNVTCQLYRIVETNMTLSFGIITDAFQAATVGGNMTD